MKTWLCPFQSFYSVIKSVGEIILAYKFHVDQNHCKGCGLCVSICPKNVLKISDEVNANGYFPVCQARSEDCNFCAMCCVMCPDVALSITEIIEDTAVKEVKSHVCEGNLQALEEGRKAA
jgi:2-oxoglutarate ferredoxin oxidoreductase subunit delta